MSTGTGRGLRPGGVIRALGRLSLMTVFGFGAGLLAGVLSEEPELLAGHLRGESEAVELAPNRRVSTTDFEIATTAGDRRPTRDIQTGAESEQRLPQVAASAAMRATETPQVTSRPRATPAVRNDRTRPWAIQVGAFSQERAARKLSQTLDAKGYPTQVLAAGNSTGRWRVRVQPVDGEVEAREMAAELKRIERLPTWVLPLEGASSR